MERIPDGRSHPTASFLPLQAAVAAGSCLPRSAAQDAGAGPGASVESRRVKRVSCPTLHFLAICIVIDRDSEAMSHCSVALDLSAAIAISPGFSPTARTHICCHNHIVNPNQCPNVTLCITHTALKRELI